MAKLTFLEGRWSGQGWSLTPNGEKAPFRQTEEIAFELGGRILIIRGKGYFDLDDAPDFEAFAVVSFDDRDNSYAFRSYAQGYAGTFAADVPAADTLVWKAGPGVRYTLTASDGRWHEIGERRGGDGNWVKFLEMDLTRAD